MRKWAPRIGIAIVVLAALVVGVDWLCFQGSGPRPAHVANAARLFPADAPQPPPAPAIAILVNGALDAEHNHRRYWNNLSLMYRALRASGYRDVVALDADGEAGKEDRLERSFLGMFGVGELEDSPLDLDGDGMNDVRGPATRAALEDAIREAGQRLGRGEGLLLAMTDHGQLRFDDWRLRAVAMLWEEELHGEELGAMLEEHIPDDAWVAVVAMQCHGEIFLGEIDRSRTMLIASGSPLWIWSTQDYSVFPYHFAAALLRRDPETLDPIDADRTADGIVDLREAFDVAVARDRAPEWPKVWILGDETTMPRVF